MQMLHHKELITWFRRYKDHLEDASLHAKSEASHGGKLRESSSKTIARIIEAGESENRGLRLAKGSYLKAKMLFVGKTSLLNY